MYNSFKDNNVHFEITSLIQNAYSSFVSFLYPGISSMQQNMQNLVPNEKYFGFAHCLSQTVILSGDILCHLWNVNIDGLSSEG